MAYLPPDTAIFSPSVARAAASAARDWNFVDSWLSAKFHTTPTFERNADTLRLLLALASANELADEARDLLARVEASALHEIEAHEQQEQNKSKQHDGRRADGGTLRDARTSILEAVEDGLPQDDRVALDAMATASVDLGLAFADPSSIGLRMVELQAEVHELEQMATRVSILQTYVEGETQETERLLEEVRRDDYRPAPDLAKQNLETKRKVKALMAKLPEWKGRVTALATAVGVPSPTIQQVCQEEEKYLGMLYQKRELDAQLDLFEGLPPDTAHARQQLENLRTELRQTTKRRDAIFEGLVERETPRKLQPRS